MCKRMADSQSRRDPGHERLVESLCWNFSSVYYCFKDWGGGFDIIHEFIR